MMNTEGPTSKSATPLETLTPTASSLLIPAEIGRGFLMYALLKRDNNDWQILYFGHKISRSRVRAAYLSLEDGCFRSGLSVH